MKIDEMLLIGGSDINVDGVVIKQPKLDAIRRPEVGFERYNAYLNIMAMTRDDLINGVFAEAPDALKEQLTVYLAVSAFPEFRALAEGAFAFFLDEPVRFDAERAAFVSESGAEINEENFDTIRGVVLQICGAESDEVDEPMPKGKKARELWLKRQEGRKQKRASRKSGGKDLSLPNIISAVGAKNAGYNLTNIWSLTVWQLYDQFGRINVNSQMEIVGLRWAAWGKDEFPMDNWYKNNKAN